MSLVETTLGLFTQPRKVFDSLADKPRVLWPLLLTLALTLGLMAFYTLKVDREWLLEQQMLASPMTARMSEEERQRIVEAQLKMPQAVMLTITLVSVAAGVLLMRLLQAAYLTLAGKITNVDRSFKQWFSLAVWTGVPAVIIGFATGFLILMLSNTTQLDPGAIQPLSFNELFFQKTLTEKGYNLLSSIGLLQILSFGLAIIGVKQWSRRSWLFASIYVLLPIILIFGGWGWWIWGRG